LAAYYGDFCVTRLVQAVSASSLIVFASACYGDGASRVPGYFRVEPPYLSGRRWATEYHDAASYLAYGNVDFRHGGKAVAAMLDGHVELLEFEQIDDMRRWSNQAAASGDSEHYLGKTIPSP
jgi:prepilin-type processing-associated H-X9-DG protein